MAMSVSHEDLLVAVTQVKVAVATHSDRILDQENRMRKLETFKASVLGWAAGAAAVGAFLANLALGLLK